MLESRPPMQMPEILVFVRVFLVGAIAMEMGRITYFASQQFVPLLSDIGWLYRAIGIVFCATVCFAYAFMRDAHQMALRLARSLRVDLLLLATLGAWTTLLITPWLAPTHEALMAADSALAPTILLASLLLLLSSMLRDLMSRKKRPIDQLYFLTDDDIDSEADDVLQIKKQAEGFAATVLASGAHSGLVFGIDGPWGIGKSSYLNFAEQYWAENATNSVIVFRFEPLRYASDLDLSERFIRELSTIIQRQIYAPEFGPAVNRYTKMLKGKADFSFLGFKLSFEHSNETIDELLEDVDNVLKRTRKRVIVVVDDLDRLEPKAVNNVLYTVRRTFRLSQATYVLCFDTENLILGREEGEKAREFLEKFIAAKLSLFVDSSTLRKFLETDWANSEHKMPSIPSDTMFLLSAILREVANMVDGTLSYSYSTLIGDMRKLKRFVNALLLIQFEKTDLGKTDFIYRDLINLILLHLYYPGVFRRIYAEETEGRSGIFCVVRDKTGGSVTYSNKSEFKEFLTAHENSQAGFLLRQLFDVTAREKDLADAGDEVVQSSLACFNQVPYRNLEKYLKLIVRFVAPVPQETFKTYQDSVDRVIGEKTSIATIFDAPIFSLQLGELAHDQFWRVLASRSHDFNENVANDAINTLIKYLPRYTIIGVVQRGLRERSIYTLLRILDRAGWGRTQRQRRNNTPGNIVEIADHILGTGNHFGNSLIDRLASGDRGVLGWNDLVLFRLQCSADRQGQIHQLQSSLILHQDLSAQTTGRVDLLAVRGMRVLSQRVFKQFREHFIDPGRNFFTDANNVSDKSLMGDMESWLREEFTNIEEGRLSLEGQLLAARSSVKNFVIFQLSNKGNPSGSGVGCGLYDEGGEADRGGIGDAMNKYVFEFCFNPQVDKGNALLFAEFCLCNLVNGFHYGRDDEGYIATAEGLTSGFDLEMLRRYWKQHRQEVKKLNFQTLDRQVVTSYYIATFKADLPKVLEVLDRLVESEANAVVPAASSAAE
ncbi:MAG: KAP family NTPase [Rhodoferax sp.]